MVESANAGGSCFQTAPVMLDVTRGDITEPAALTTNVAGSIEGTLTGSAKPSEFEISLGGTSGPVQLAFPDQKARFHFAGLRPGRYWLAVHSRAGNELDTLTEWNIPAGASTNLEIPAPKQQ
jgi:hypothetical protein